MSSRGKVKHTVSGAFVRRYDSGGSSGAQLTRTGAEWREIGCRRLSMNMGWGTSAGVGLRGVQPEVSMERRDWDIILGWAGGDGL